MNKDLSKGIILNDRYRIGQKLGEGGFALTYLAEDLEYIDENYADAYEFIAVRVG